MMNPSDRLGAPWSDDEIDAIVAVYFEMLEMEHQGRRYVKLRKNEELQEQLGRTHRSIEFKHRNISAVLQSLALQWIPGYKPGDHYQKALIAGVERYLDEHPEAFAEPQLAALGESAVEQEYLAPEQAPDRIPNVLESSHVLRLTRKFDPAARDARNRELGKLGEKRILLSERARLAEAGRKDLAHKVKWVSQEEGDGEGYDILSFSDSGAERLLEVKTTTGYRYTPFYLTENERLLSQERPQEFRLMRLYDFIRQPRVFRLAPPLEESVVLKPASYRASFHVAQPAGARAKALCQVVQF